ncbi:MAG: hypothetical protein GY756_20520 [bacterium]|nr:hypothetical protein [bacterium]
MENIEYFSSTLIAGETNSLGDEVVVACEQEGEIDTNITNFVSNIKTHNSQLTRVIKSSRKNPLTEQLHDLGTDRSSLYHEGKGLAKAYSCWSIDPVKKEAGTFLTEIFARHGSVTQNSSHQEQNSILGSFLSETSEAVSQTHFATLGMSEWNVSLTELHKSYKELFKDKESYEINKESIDKKETQTPVSDSIKELIAYLNGMVSINSNNEQWMKLFNDVNGIVKRVMISSKIRRSNHKNNSEE